ncbi:MAG: hypothetical protein Q4F95_09840 [Oscillospiraceae bacterium]|nr:hypothetical protein [Oscillospiraceae bacterium]
MISRKKTILCIILCTIAVASCLVLNFLCTAKKINARNKRNALISQASENAERYIKEKYGFDAKMIGRSSDKYHIRFNDYCPYIEFEMKYKDKKFYVVTDTTPGTSYYEDDYQYDEILAAAENYLFQNLSDYAVIDMFIRSPDSCLKYLMNKDIIYNGSNIIDVLNKCSVSIEMVMSDQYSDLSDLDIIDKLSSGDYTIQLTSFDTKAHMNEFIKSTGKVAYYYRNEWRYEKYAPYITDYYYDDGEQAVEQLDISFQKTDDFEYAYFPEEENAYSKTSNNIKIQLSVFKIIKTSFNQYGEAGWLSKPITNEYTLDGAYGDVWIYYPLEKLKDYDIENVGLAWYSFGGESNNRDIIGAKICGDYAVFGLPDREICFKFVDNSGQDKYVPGSKQTTDNPCNSDNSDNSDNPDNSENWFRRNK